MTDIAHWPATESKSAPSLNLETALAYAAFALAFAISSAFIAGLL